MKRALKKNRMKHALENVIGLAVLLAPLPFAARPQDNPRAPGSESDTARKVQAKATFERVCASCHGLDGRGGERGPDLVSRREVVGKTDADLVKIVEEGRVAAGMPSFASQGAERLSAIVSYLRTLQGVKTVASLPGDSERGRAIFYGKAHCSQCHMVDGQGGFLAQDLSGYGTAAGVDGIRGAIVNPNKDLDPRRGLITVTLVDSTMLLGLPRNQDNFSLQMQTLDGAFHLLNKSDIRKLKYEGRSAMPADYGRKLSPEELNDLISFLLYTSGPTKTPRANKNSDDEEQE